MTLFRENLAWAAGFFDGEGSTIATHSRVAPICEMCGVAIVIRRSRDYHKRFCTRQCWLQRRNETNWQSTCRHENQHGRAIHGYGGGGSRRTREYRVWVGIRSRCRRHPFYVRHGIQVCPEWNDPVTFIRYVLDNLGPHPGKDWSIDRIDNERGYEPGNIRWATILEQRHNQRRYIERHGR